MLLQPSRLKTQGAVLAITTGFALHACSDPTAQTDLRPAGDPEVLAVLVMNDPDALLYERATFCKTNDAKRPSLVGITDFTTLQICPDDLAMGAPKIVDAVPTGWYVRIMFDELLDPTVEDLLPICNDSTETPVDCADPTAIPTGTFTGSLLVTQPVILTCNGVAVPYDGYYVPGGNNVTWPLGPSLFIQPLDTSTVPTGANCTVEIKDSVTDKEGNPVPADQRGTGGIYSFTVAGLAITGIAPAPSDSGMEEEITADAPLVITFNAPIDAASLAPAEVKIAEGADCAAARAALTAGAGLKTAVIDADPSDPNSIDISIAGAPAGEFFNEDKAYAVTFADGATIQDVAGGPLALTPDDLVQDGNTLCFTTVAP